MLHHFEQTQPHNAKNTKGSSNPNKGKAPAPNPAIIDLFVDSEAVTRPKSTDPGADDLNDSVEDVITFKAPDGPEVNESEDEDDPEVSTLVKSVKSVKAG